MQPKSLRLGALLVLGAVLTALGSVDAGTKSDKEVKVTASATKIDPQGKQVITITLAPNSGWYVYANPVGNKELEAAETVISLKGKMKLKDVAVNYPGGTLVPDKVVGDYKVYDGKTEIQATVIRAAGDTGPLEVSVQFQACHKKGVCLLPAKVKLSVP